MPDSSDHPDPSPPVLQYRTPAARPRRRWFTFTPWEIAATLALAFLFMMMLARFAPSGGSWKERHNRDRCSSQLNQIGRALAAYAQDHAGHLPPGLDALIAQAYAKPALFVCPSGTDECASGATPDQVLADFVKPGRCSYLYLGTGMQRPVPPNTMIACDHLLNHEAEGIFVLYGSGTVKWVPAPQAQKLLTSLQPGYVPPRPSWTIPPTQPATEVPR